MDNNFPFDLNDNGYEQPPIESKPKVNNSRVITIIVSVALSLVVGAASGFGAAFIGMNYFKEPTTQNESSSNTVSSSDNMGIVNISVDKTVESVIEAVAEKVRPSVVGIRTLSSYNSFFGSGEEATGEGSGIIYTNDGYIITNYHVIENAIGNSKSRIEVFLESDPNNGIEATIVGYNISYDLAVVKIKTSKKLNAIELSTSENLKVGQFVAAVGNPGGIEFMGSVTYGIISGLNRTVSDGSTNDAVPLIQTDAAINPGNSGGALVNTKGQLIGVNSSKIVSESYEGMGFAIPVDEVKEICNKIIDREYAPTPYIGITISERYDAATLKYLGYPAGAVVQNVVDGGPASDAGIKRGHIITEFNGIKITDYTVLTKAISECTPNEVITVVVYESGKYYSTSLTVGSNNQQ
ncbi:MAG: trypsin-like peptidase domain-containing protein [Clostridia bacterium]|nr:trypsin-like peptidase domain-containing protein [Clostridia bacterium]